jgi:hypothetical protein
MNGGGDSSAAIYFLFCRIAWRDDLRRRHRAKTACRPVATTRLLHGTLVKRFGFHTARNAGTQPHECAPAERLKGTRLQGDVPIYGLTDCGGTVGAVTCCHPEECLRRRHRTVGPYTVQAVSVAPSLVSG